MLSRIRTVLGVAALLFAGWVSVSAGSVDGHEAYQGKAPWASVEGAEH